MSKKSDKKMRDENNKKYLRPAGDRKMKKAWEEGGMKLSRKKYNKLVRDNVVDNLKRKGLDPKYRKAKDDNEYWEYLKKKLEEKMYELFKALDHEDEKKQHEEFIDVMEVFDAMFEFLGLKEKYMEHLKKEKARKKGKFKKRLILEEV